MDALPLVGFDYETRQFGPENLTPRPVSLAALINTDEASRYPHELEVGEDDLTLASAGDGDLDELIDELLTAPVILTGARTAYDLSVAAASYWEDSKPRSGGRFSAIFEAISDGRVSDIQIREKLLNLAQYGSLEYVQAPDGSNVKVTYSLAALAKSYLGIDMSAEKSGDDAWRTNYEVLEDSPVSEWPAEAIDYAVNDAIYPTLIWRHQEDRRREIESDIGCDPLRTEAFRVLVDFCLYLMSAHGVAVDSVEHSKILKELNEALLPEKLDLLVTEGILRPGKVPKPYSNGAKIHAPECKGAARKTCGCPLKLTRGTKDSIDKGELERFAMFLKQEFGERVNLRYSPKGNLKLDKEFMADHAHLSPVLRQYQGRQSVQKLVTTDMPRMEWPKGSGVAADVLHASYDCLKETGRTSSYASKAYPSWNCQNPHPRVRACIVPRPGFVLYSVDYSTMELGTLAQKCFELFGFSVLRDVINKGWDAHAYLGAYLAFYLDEDFHDSVIEECGETPDGQQLYQAFARCATSSHEAVRAFYKHYRTFAKPTGLGYPGGLGPETFVAYAHATYGIEVDEATARELREVWHRAFPEMALYLNWISECEDPNHASGYAYLTPLGLYRANASYCAAANGAGLQAPSAEGALLAVCSVVEATFADVGSVLYDDEQGPRHRSILFIHDELIGEARIDCAHEVSHEVARIMVDSMREITPDVTPKAQPVLMTQWDKQAEAVYKEGRLVPWAAKKVQK